MNLASLAMLLAGLVMIGLGIYYVTRFAAHNRLDERPVRPQPQSSRGPGWTQRALLGAILISLGLLLSVFGALTLVAGPPA